MMRKDVKPAITKLKNDQVNHDTQTKMCVIMINDDNIQEGSNTVIPFTYIFENSDYQSRPFISNYNVEDEFNMAEGN